MPNSGYRISMSETPRPVCPAPRKKDGQAPRGKYPGKPGEYRPRGGRTKLQDFILRCEQATSRLSTLGNWPAWVDARECLVDRIPSEGKTAPGFDAGLACALGIIPEAKQALAATLHAAYTPAAVDQVRQETAGDLDADSESAWWLAMCSICREGEVDSSAFLEQIEQARQLATDPAARATATRAELDATKKKFVALGDGTPFAVQDGGLQGAYLSGHAWGVLYVEAYGIFFIGTFLPSLGLEDFTFSSRVDVQGRPMSGPVYGSRQFVKVSDLNELASATALVRRTLG